MKIIEASTGSHCLKIPSSNVKGIHTATDGATLIFSHIYVYAFFIGFMPLDLLDLIDMSMSKTTRIEWIKRKDVLGCELLLLGFFL